MWYPGNDFLFRDSCVKSLCVKAGVWVWRGNFLVENGFFMVQYCPPDRILSFCNEEKKSINIGELFSRTSAIGSKEKLFVISTRKNLFFCVTLRLLEVFKFHHSVRRVFRSGGWFGLFLNVY